MIVCSYCRILYIIEDEQHVAALHNKMDESHKVEWKKSDIEEYLLYNSICIQHKNDKAI